jgi:3-(3-hydroxy-phenyl)propionate hydroxylase/6-hydroxy-3-succinoylpyridine 3-monooxygenase
MNMSAERNVLVVGAGPVGLVTALGLVQEGIEVTVIDAAEEIGTAPRAMGYMWTVSEGLDRLGMLDDALRIGYPVQNVRFRVLQTNEFIDIDNSVLEGHVDYPYFLTLSQDLLTDIALEHLDRHGGATVLRSTAAKELIQDEDGVTVVVESPEGQSEIRAGWVVGADGARSAVRRSLGLEFQGFTWPELFVATNVHYDFPALGHDVAGSILDPDYGAICAKINREGLWRVTFHESGDLPDETAGERIPAYFAKIVPDPENVELVQYTPYRMHQRAAETLHAGRAVLVGDAAHVTNPIGGLGCTTGLHDAYVLYEALAAVIRGTTDESILDAYSDARRGVFWDWTSPMASENKNNLYNRKDMADLEQHLEELRATSSDPELRLKGLLMFRNLVTPSLVSDASR